LLEDTTIRNKAIFLAHKNIAKVAPTLGLTYQDFLFCTYDEISSKKIPPNTVIAARKQEFTCDFQNGSLKIMIMPEHQNYVDLFLTHSGSSQEVKGRAAYLGLVRGPAKIILTSADLSKLDKGDILITSMTTPNMVPAMGKAAAFVTDEGGITCHAAIVAREMKKPCITGTKIATRTFKDGDMVEVDANKGIVRKVK